MCVFHGIRIVATNYIGWPTSRFAIRSFDNARVVQERMQRQARLAFAKPQPTLAEHFPNALQRYEIYRALPNFDPRFGAIFCTKLPNFNEP